MCDCEEKSASSRIQTANSGQLQSDQLQDQIQKIGRRTFLRKIRSAAKSAISRIPDEDEIEKADPAFRQYVGRISTLMEDALKAPEWDDAQIARFAQEVAWAKLVADVAATVIARDNEGTGTGGGGGPTCATQCVNEYQQCVSENGCDTSGWVCLCCVPCSLQYMGCVARCASPFGGFGGGGVMV